MMSLAFLYLQSSLHTDPTLVQRAITLFDLAAQQTGETFEKASSTTQLQQQPLSLVYVATGGTAGLLKAALPFLPQPVVLITSGSDNSLSASMEMLTYLQQKGRKGRILHGSQEKMVTQLRWLTRAATLRQDLKSLRLGMVGRPSDWLISSDTDYQALQQATGVRVFDIPMEELLLEIAQKSYPDCPDCQTLLATGFNRAEVEKALHIYGALSRLVERYQLDGLSVRCFDLLTAVKSTGCLGAALLNSKGIFCGCEGDFPSLLSMVILGKLSGRPVFQCNPSRIEEEDNRIVFAHCTLPLNMPDRYILDTHFESNIGVAVAGDIPLGSATIFKSSGDLGCYFASAGEISAQLHEPNLCRSQIQVDCYLPVELFLTNPIGNHYLVCHGDVTAGIEEFFAML